MSDFSRRIQHEAQTKLRQVMRGRQRILDGEDGEAVHNFRVAFRQLRALLAPWRDDAAFKRLRRPMKQLKHKVDQTNEMRDAEVQDALLRELSPDLDMPLAAWLAEREANRQQAEKALTRQLARDAVPEAANKVRKRLRKGLKHRGRKSLKLALVNYEETVCERMRAALADETALFADAAHWHALRLDCKRWRYLMESHGKHFRPHWLEASSAARQAQDALGRLRDLNLLTEELNQANVATAGVQALLENEHTRRTRIAREALHGLAEYLNSQAEPKAAARPA